LFQVVAPKVGFLPPKAFRGVIPFADSYLPAAVSEIVLLWPLGYFGRFVGWTEEYGWLVYLPVVMR